MNHDSMVLFSFGAIIAMILARRLWVRLQLSRAKHRSLAGHAKMARFVARLVPFYEYTGEQFYSSDGAPAEVVACRRGGFGRLAAAIRARSPQSIAFNEQLEDSLSDVLFTNLYRVPFQYRRQVRDHLRLGSVVTESRGTMVRDLDGNWSHDLTGAYGVNVFGYDFYKACIEKAVERAGDMGPVLGPYHPVVADNVARLKAISGLDEVSFHMSGTEAVMQAVRLARFHTGKRYLVRFCGAYHGWWDGVQPGIGSERAVHDVYTLKDMHEQTLKVLRTRDDIGCVLVNPLQAIHPNANAPGDGMLVNSDRKAAFDRETYSRWLRRLRDVCTQRNIVLIFDEIFVGFRLCPGGAQDFFGVRADMVTYGKTLGGGLPVGVVCGTHRLMRRFRDDRPTDICFARGTFNAHPYVMTAMNEFLRRLDTPEIRAGYQGLESRWNARVAQLNDRLAARELPVRFANLVSICTTLYQVPSRYNWMFQFYLTAQGLTLSWVGSGRFIFSHNYGDDDFAVVADRIVAAAEAMKADGWWWTSPALTNAGIKRHILREMLGQRLGLGGSATERHGGARSTGES